MASYDDIDIFESPKYFQQGGKAGVVENRKARRQARRKNRQENRQARQSKRADNKILPIHMRAYLGSALTRIKKGYTIDDLDKEERLALYQFMLPLVEQSPQGSWTYDETEGGFRAVMNPLARKQLEKIREQGFFKDEMGNKIYVTKEDIDTSFKDWDIPLSTKEFLQRQGDPTAALEYFLGGAGYTTDDRGHIIISDEYDFNINRKGGELSPETGKGVGRGEVFARSLVPQKMYLYNLIHGLGTLVGPAEGRGAPIRLDLGTPEYIREQLQQAGVEGYYEGGQVSRVFDKPIEGNTKEIM